MDLEKKATETISEIKQAEEYAKKVVESAKMDREYTVSEARRRAMAMVEDAEKSMDALRKSSIAEAEKALDGEKAELEKQHKQALAEMRKKAEKHMEAATKLVLERFKEEIKRA